MGMKLVLIFLAALVQAGASSAQDITVRLLKPSGSPVAQEAIWVQFTANGEHQRLDVTTSPVGTVKIHLPQPIPSQIYVVPTYAEHLDPCSQLLPVDTQQVIAAGVVRFCSKGKPGCRCKFSKQVTHLSTSPG